MGELHLSSYKRSFRQTVMGASSCVAKPEVMDKLHLRVERVPRCWERSGPTFVAIAGLANRPKNIRIHLAVSHVRFYLLRFNSSGNFCDGWAICSRGIPTRTCFLFLSCRRKSASP